MADTRSALATAEALILARQRLRMHLRKVAELAGRGNIPAARMIADDDVISDLDDIQHLLDLLDLLEEEAVTDG